LSVAESSARADVTVTVDLAEELLSTSTAASMPSSTSQFHTTVIVHSSADQQATTPTSCEETIDELSATGDQSNVAEQSDTTAPAAKGASIETTPLSANTTQPAGAESAVSDSRPAPSRRPISRSQLSQGQSTGPLHHGGGSMARSNNELSHHAVMGALFRRHSKAEVAAVARRQQQEAAARASMSSNQASGGGANSMSVSVPNLTSTMEQTVSLLESFAAVARRNLGNNTNNLVAAVTGVNNNPCSSLVRLALSSNSPGKFLLLCIEQNLFFFNLND